MKLTNVAYEFFDFEEASSGATELWRQIRLQFADAPTLYVSWTWERQHGPEAQPYAIAVSNTSYFQDSAATVLDASAADSWSFHVGRDVKLGHLAADSEGLEYQILEIQSEGGRTFVSALGCDRLRVSREPPRPTCQNT